MALFVSALNEQVVELDESGVRLRFIGDLKLLNPLLQKAIKAAETRTRDNSRMTLVLAVAYGGRWDITRGAKQLAEEIAAGTLDPEEIDEDRFAASLAMAEFPTVDLLIRTGGEQRVSNFLLWDLAYSELYFSSVLWPDFSMSEVGRAFEFYASRQRRFGQTGDQVEAASC
jgi:undecaprenyl diphosphate synthase